MIKNEEDDKSLFDRITTMLEAVNLKKELSPIIASTIATAEMSGKKADDITRKLVVLLDQKKITSDEHIRWVNYYVANEWKKQPE